METIYKKYFENLDDARRAQREKDAELRKKYNCYFCVAVWDAADDRHFEDGRFFRYILTADIWPDTIIR
jgi:hypothetical protein